MCVNYRLAQNHNRFFELFWNFEKDHTSSAYLRVHISKMLYCLTLHNSKCIQSNNKRFKYIFVCIYSCDNTSKFKKNEEVFN